MHTITISADDLAKLRAILDERLHHEMRLEHLNPLAPQRIEELQHLLKVLNEGQPK